MTQTTYAQLEKYMLACMRDAAHDPQHIYRVLYNALAIAATEQGVDTDILLAACLLHDIGRKAQYQDPTLCHATVGGEMAYTFLLQQGFDASFAARVQQCIQSHRYRKSDPPQSIEAKILFDADKLEAAGAIGVARTLMYKGIVGQPLYTPAPDGGVLDGTQDTAPSFLQEYHFKLQKLYDGFYTAEGRRLAAQRRQAAKDFAAALYREAVQTHQNAALVREVLS